MAYKRPKQKLEVAVDSVIFTIENDELNVLLIQMHKDPFKGSWAVPGGLIEQTETTKDAALRILEKQTSVKNVYLEQLGTFDDPERDPLGRVISVAYFALVNNEDTLLHKTDKYADVRWWSVKKLPKLAYDHKQILKTAVERLQAKLEYTNVVWSLLPKEFALTDLQRVYEVILQEPIDKRNFRKKILSLKLIEKTGKKRAGEANRPAELYRFKKRSLQFVDIL